MTVITTLVPERRRLSITEKYFKHFFPFQVEPVIYYFASQLSSSYGGGYWHFYTLSNGGFYMAPDFTKSFTLVSMNGFEGQVSADALGVIVCLYAYSYLSSSKETDLTEICASHYHRLRDFAFEHGEAKAIFSAID